MKYKGMSDTKDDLKVLKKAKLRNHHDGAAPGEDENDNQESDTKPEEDGEDGEESNSDPDDDLA